jgi:HAD superfamily hydrolase (TIGR01509 family)
VSWDLVIFDCDGVLVDSEPIANRILTEMLNELGLPIGPTETRAAFVGRSMSSCLEIIGARLGRPAPPGFARAYEARLFAAFDEELHPVAGVVEALGRIRVPLCVASSSSLERMRLALGVTGLLPRFEGRMFSASEVEQGKPDPALFLHAARILGARPRACAVVEDTDVGVQAGQAAGMTVFAFAGGGFPTLTVEHGAIVFDDMGELPGLLDSQRPDPSGTDAD